MSSRQQTLSGVAEAVATCPAGIEDCTENGGTDIIPRRVPLAPIVDVPLSVGTTNSPNSFTSTSLMVTIMGDIEDDPSTSCTATEVTEFKVEWDTNPSFNSLGVKPMSYDENQLTSPEVTAIDIVTDSASNSRYSARYNITDLTLGSTYYIRVSAMNSLGYGATADYQDAIPLTSADAPGFPTTIAQLDEVFTTTGPAACIPHVVAYGTLEGRVVPRLTLSAAIPLHCRVDTGVPNLTTPTSTKREN